MTIAAALVEAAAALASKEHYSGYRSRMAEEAEADYVVTRHAPVKGDPDVCWVAVARSKRPDGSTQWCLEYWDDGGEADQDADVPDEASAVERAREEFGIGAEDWRSGPQPWGRSE